ncbi:MAG: type II secretion system F family protein [Bradymonadaceae bacterium]
MTNPGSNDFEDREPVVREHSTYLTDKDAKRMCALFADGLETGMGISRIFELMERQGFDKALITRLRGSMMDQGDMLGEAFARHGILDPAARKLVLVAEQQGKLPGTFRQLSLIYGKRHDRKKKFFFAMVEPMVLIILSMFFLRNLLTADLAEITFKSDTTHALKAIFIQSGIESLIFGLFVAVIVMISMNLPVEFGLRSAVHRMVLRIPVAGDSGNLYAISTFCRYVKQSLASGLTAYRALELAAEASNAPKIWGRIDQAQDHIAGGGTIAQALFLIKAFPDDVIEGIDIGEESGRLEERLQQLAERYETLSEEAFERSKNATIYILRMAIIVGAVGLTFISLLGVDLGF